MGWLSKPRLTDLIGQQSSRLDAIFGFEAWKLERVSEDATIIRTATLEIELGYDWRDEWIASYLTALQVPRAISMPHPVETWLRFKDIEPPPPRKSTLDEQQVIDALNLIAQAVVHVFSEAHTTRDAAFFAWGYNTAYNDWASRRGSWTAIQ